MRVKKLLQIVVEFLTGKKCSKCVHYQYRHCVYIGREKCVHSIYPIGFKERKY